MILRVSTLWKKEARELGISEEMIREALEEFASYSYWDADTKTTHLEACMRDALTNMLSSAESVRGVISMKTGCGAGGACAGMIFTLAFAKPVRMIRRMLAERGLSVSCVASADVENGGEEYLHEASYEDDFACVITSQAGELIGDVQAAMAIIWKVFAIAGFALNMSPTKTATVLRWGGAKASVAKKKFRCAMKDKITFEAGSSTLEPDAVPRYKHMGSYSDVSFDISFKCAAVHPVIRSLSARVFQDSDITTAAKNSVLRSLLMSKLSYQCGVAIAHAGPVSQIR